MYLDTPLRQVTAVLYLVIGAGNDKQTHVPHDSVFITADILEKLTNQMRLQTNDSYVEFEVSTQELTNFSM